jgi:hypothetical protein
MGRWAQASRTGGGPTGINYMLQAVDSASDAIEVTYALDVGAGALTLANFVSNPTAQAANSVAQTGRRKVEFTFPLSIAADTTLVYNGTIPNFQTPQTVNH